MIGANLLNYLIIQEKVLHPDHILSLFNLQFRKALRQEEKRNDDGMEIGLCVWNPKKQNIEFAGANLPLIYFKNGPPTELRGTRKPIGGRQKEELHRFTLHKIQLETPTTFYLFSDGFSDQNQERTGAKFSRSRFKDLLCQVHDLPMNEQKETLEKSLADWQHYHSETIFPFGV